MFNAIAFKKISRVQVTICESGAGRIFYVSAFVGGMEFSACSTNWKGDLRGAFKAVRQISRGGNVQTEDFTASLYRPTDSRKPYFIVEPHFEIQAVQ